MLHGGGNPVAMGDKSSSAHAPPSARAQSQLRRAVCSYISLITCRWRWARNDSTAHMAKDNMFPTMRERDFHRWESTVVGGKVIFMPPCIIH